MKTFPLALANRDILTLKTNISNSTLNFKVIIPVYNEEKTIFNLISKINNTFDKLDEKVEIICIDDGSTDKTIEKIKRCNVILLNNIKNLGKGAALRKGFKFCYPLDIIITIDGDGEHNPGDIPKLLEPILTGEADIVIGSRFLNRRKGEYNHIDKGKYLSHVRKVGNKIFSLFGNLCIQEKITDTQSGFRTFGPNIVNKLNLKANGFEIETEMIVKAINKGYRIKEVPIHSGCVQRDSYMNLISDSLKIALTFLNGAVPKKIRFLNSFLIKKISKIR